MINQFQLFLIAQLDFLINLRKQAVIRLPDNTQQEIIRRDVQGLADFKQGFDAGNRMIVFDIGNVIFLYLISYC